MLIFFRLHQFFYNGVKPVLSDSVPEPFNFIFCKWHFAILIRRFSWSNFIRHFCTRSRCCSILPLLTLNISSRKQNVLVRPASVHLIAF